MYIGAFGGPDVKKSGLYGVESSKLEWENNKLIVA
jgi:hypothetical protein